MIWAVPSTRDRVLRIDPRLPASAVGSGRARPRLAGPLPRRAGAAGAGWRSSTATAHAPRRAGARVRAQPPAADGVVRAPGAAAAPSARPVDDESGAASPRASGGPARPWRCCSPSPSGPSPRRNVARRSPPKSSEARPRPPSIGSSATSTPTARGCTSTTPTTTRSPEYNEVRHAGVTMGLYQAAAAGLPGALGSADRGTEWALDRLVERDGWAALDADGRVTTGATALLIAGLVSAGEATGDTRYDDLLRRLGRFLVAQTEPSGAVLASYDPARGAPVAGRLLEVLHRRGVLGAGPPAPRLPGRGLGRGRRSHRRLPGHLARRGRGPLAADPRSLGGLRPGRDRRVPRAGPPAAHRGRGGATRAGRPSCSASRCAGSASASGPGAALVRGTYVPRGGGYGVIGEALTGLWLAARREPRLADLRDPSPSGPHASPGSP